MPIDKYRGIVPLMLPKEGYVLPFWATTRVRPNGSALALLPIFATCTGSIPVDVVLVGSKFDDMHDSPYAIVNTALLYH
jgi:hypothetical protein